MRITGAVLADSGRPAPWAVSGPLPVVELDLDAPGPDELLVRIEVAGLCHSDLSVVDGSRQRPLPMLLGHEACGRVEAVGPDGDPAMVGRRVVTTFLPRCEECAACATDGLVPCTAGSAANAAGTLLGGGRRLRALDGSPVHHHLGVSAFATRAVVDRRSVVAVDDDVPPTVAALLGCAVLTGGGAVLNVGRPAPGQTTVVVGLGGVGMAALLVALAHGAGPVVGVDAVPAKLARARELGASAAHPPAEALDLGLDAPVVVEAAGSARALETALALTGVGGRTVTVGLPAPEARASVSPLALVAGARTLVGSYLGSSVPARDVPAYARMWREGRLPVEELVSARIGLDDLGAGLDDLAAGRAVRQVVDVG